LGPEGGYSSYSAKECFPFATTDSSTQTVTVYSGCPAGFTTVGTRVRPYSSEKPNDVLYREIVCCPTAFDFDGPMPEGKWPDRIFPSDVDGTTVPLYTPVSYNNLCYATSVSALSGKTDMTLLTSKYATVGRSYTYTGAPAVTDAAWDFEGGTLFAPAVTEYETLYPIVTVINSTTVTVTETCHGKCPSTRDPRDSIESRIPPITVDTTSDARWWTKYDMDPITTKAVMAQFTPSAACTTSTNLWLRRDEDKCHGLRNVADDSWVQNTPGWLRCDETVFGLPDPHTAVLTDPRNQESCDPGYTQTLSPGAAATERIEYVYSDCPVGYKVMAYDTSSVTNSRASGTETATPLRCCPTARPSDHPLGYQPYDFKLNNETSQTRTTIRDGTTYQYTQRLPMCVATSLPVQEPTVTLKIVGNEDLVYGSSFPVTTAASRDIKEARVYADDIAVTYTVKDGKQACFEVDNFGWGLSESCFSTLPTPSLDGLVARSLNAAAGRGQGLAKGLVVTLAAMTVGVAGLVW